MWGWRSSNAKKLQCAVEYHAPHWVILLRNAGQKDWRALRDPARKISVQDEFGVEIGKRPAIQSFASIAAATAWITENLKDVERVESRTREEIDNFAKGLNAEHDLLFNDKNANSQFHGDSSYIARS
jgi:hypothetical protein